MKFGICRSHDSRVLMTQLESLDAAVPGALGLQAAAQGKRILKRLRAAAGGQPESDHVAAQASTPTCDMNASDSR